MKKKIVAVILCGGMGSRISQITRMIPKSLIKVNQRPIIWYVVASLLKNGVREIIFPLGYKGKRIEIFVKKKFKKESRYFQFHDTGEKTEIHNRIKKIIKKLKNYEDFILINSDTIFDFNLRNFINLHQKKKHLISLSGIKMESSWGTIVKNKKNLLKKFVINAQIEDYKIKKYAGFNCYRNTGISIINSKCLNYIKNLDHNFEISLYNKFVKYNKVGVKIFNKFWYPIETLKDLNILNQDKTKKKKINLIKQKLS